MKAQKSPGPGWLATAVFYQIYPQSFYDANGDGIGDLAGIIAKLDYIKSLRCTAIWLNPIFDSPFGDAGYDVRDFRKVAPRYGTNADLKCLFKEAHSRNLHVVLDLVAGHTSVEHPWFKASAKATRNRYSDYYIWTSSVWQNAAGLPQVNGYSNRDGNYVTNFFWFQPALNYGFAKPDPAQTWQQPLDAPGPRAVKAELKTMMQFWLDQGCDGFRVDMASSLIRNDPGGYGIKNFWREIRGWLDKDYPEAVLISEWSNPKQAIGAGFHVDFMIHCGEPAYQMLCNPWGEVRGGTKVHGGYFHREKPDNLEGFLSNYLAHYRATRKAGFISLPTGNHDFARFGHGRSNAEQRVFYALLLTMPGVPFIYYGDEIGLPFQEGLTSKEGAYSRTGTRTPMQWKNGRNAGFSKAAAKRLYLPVQTRTDRPTVESAEANPDSLLHLVRHLLALRCKYDALGNLGAFKPLRMEGGAVNVPFVYQRGKGKKAIVVAINSSSKIIRATLPLEVARKPLLAENVEVIGRNLCMQPVSYGVFSV
jgi:maltose alpha-D-glucosyltransferase/alpha-amylase